MRTFGRFSAAEALAVKTSATASARTNRLMASPSIADSLHVPDDHSAALAARGCERAVGRERGGVDPPDLPVEARPLAAGGCIPQSHRAVVPARKQGAVGGEAQRVDRPLVPGQDGANSRIIATVHGRYFSD